MQSAFFATAMLKAAAVELRAGTASRGSHHVSSGMKTLLSSNF
jgi:hypothetical protein